MSSFRRLVPETHPNEVVTQLRDEAFDRAAMVATDLANMLTHRKVDGVELDKAMTELQAQLKLVKYYEFRHY